MNLLSVSYRKICRVMHQLRSRKVNEKRFLMTVNCFSLKISIFDKTIYFYMFDIIMLFYISLTS